MRAALAALITAASLANAAPAEGLKPMAFLAGHCWKGEFAGSKQTDEHCFAWLLDGRALRDTHTVRSPERPDYVGETTYYWNPAAKRVEWLYIENRGGISRGTVESAAGALVFPPTEFVGDGQTMTYRIRWTPVDDNAYEAWSEAKTDHGWSTMFKLTMKRSP
ncbi:MAG: hypothetical protein ACREYD_00165 [Casimicrobiaceae bacterium]